MSIFRDLSFEEEFEFRLWARDNFKPFSFIPNSWHPVVRDECLKMNNEALVKELTEDSNFVDDLMAGDAGLGK